MAVMNINSKKLKAMIENGKTFLVDFWAPWCPHCRKINPAYEQIAEQYAGVLDVVKVDMDENDKLKAQIKELKEQIEMMKQSMILSPNEIRGGIWYKEGYNCVVIQTDDNEFMLINCDNYNRYYDETFARESIVGRLIEKGWVLKSKGGN